MSRVQERLGKDHAEIHALLECLEQDVDAPGCGALATSWAALEERLLRHMRAEELYLLPLLEASHPTEVERTHAEHARIRELVDELGVAVELHTARKPAITELIELLKLHSAREDEALYSWAGDKASTAVQRSLFSALRGTLQTALSSAKPSLASSSRRRSDS